MHYNHREIFRKVPREAAREGGFQDFAPRHNRNNFCGVCTSFFARIDELAATIFCDVEKFARFARGRGAIFRRTFQMEKRFVLRGGVAPFAQNESQSYLDNSLRRGVRDFDFVEEREFFCVWEAIQIRFANAVLRNIFLNVFQKYFRGF